MWMGLGTRSRIGDEFCTNSARGYRFCTGNRFCTEVHPGCEVHVQFNNNEYCIVHKIPYTPCVTVVYLRSALRSYCIHKLYIHIVLSWKMAAASALRHQLCTDLRACSYAIDLRRPPTTPVIHVYECSGCGAVIPGMSSG